MVAIQKKRVEVTLASCYCEGMDALIQDGLYESQAEVLKDALRRLLTHYGIRIITEELNEK